MELAELVRMAIEGNHVILAGDLLCMLGLLDRLDVSEDDCLGLVCGETYCVLVARRVEPLRNLIALLGGDPGSTTAIVSLPEGGTPLRCSAYASSLTPDTLLNFFRRKPHPS